MTRPAINDQRPTTNHQRPTINDQRSTINDQRRSRACSRQHHLDPTAGPRRMHREQALLLRKPVCASQPVRNASRCAHRSRCATQASVRIAAGTQRKPVCASQASAQRKSVRASQADAHRRRCYQGLCARDRNSWDCISSKRLKVRWNSKFRRPPVYRSLSSTSAEMISLTLRS
jgi:hypothetical protein